MSNYNVLIGERHRCPDYRAPPQVPADVGAYSEMCTSLGLVDAWLELRPTATAAQGITRWRTAHGRRTSGTRSTVLCCLSAFLRGQRAALPTIPTVMTGLGDHHALVVHVISPRLVDIGPGLWRMPCSLPGVEEFLLAQPPRVKEFVSKATSLPDGELARAYAAFKEDTRIIATAFSQDLKRVRKARQA